MKIAILFSGTARATAGARSGCAAGSALTGAPCIGWPWAK
jgi:hypothetical protein